jgi:hypothetical protein
VTQKMRETINSVVMLGTEDDTQTWQNEHTMKNNKSDSKYNIMLQHNTGSYI